MIPFDAPRTGTVTEAIDTRWQEAQNEVRRLPVQYAEGFVKELGNLGSVSFQLSVVGLVAGVTQWFGGPVAYATAAAGAIAAPSTIKQIRDTVKAQAVNATEPDE